MASLEALEQYLDEFYLGWFNQEKLHEYLKRCHITWHESAFVFYYQASNSAPRDIPLEGALLLSIGYDKDFSSKPQWRFYPDIKSSYLKEKLIRCAVTQLRINSGESVYDPPAELMQEVKEALAEISTKNLRLSRQLHDFSRQPEQARIKEISLKAEKKEPLPSRLQEWFLDLELQTQKTIQRKKQSGLKTKQALFSVIMEVSGRNIKLTPSLQAIKTQKEGGSLSRPVPLTKHQMERYEILKMPIGILAFLESHLSSQEEKSLHRLKRDQWNQLIQVPLRDCLDELESNQFLVKSEGTILPADFPEQASLHIQCLPCRLATDRLSFRYQLRGSTDQRIGEALSKVPNSIASRDQVYLLLEQGSRARVLKLNKSEEILTFLEFLEENPVIPHGAFEALISHVEQMRLPGIEFAKSLVKRYELAIDPVPSLKILDPGKESHAYLHLDFNYPKAVQNYLEVNPVEGVVEPLPNPEFEKLCHKFLVRWSQGKVTALNNSIRKLGYFFNYQISKDDFEHFLKEGIFEFFERGFEFFHVRRQSRIRRASGLQWGLNAKKNKNWFQLGIKIKDEEDPSLFIDPDLLRDGFVNGSQSELVLLGEEELKELTAAHELVEEVDHKVPQSLFPAFQAYFGKLIIEAPLFQKLRQDEEKLKTLTHPKRVPVPQGLSLPLRPYQLEGYYFLHNLKKHGYHGVLADDMGLGKTVQSLSFLLSIFERNPESKFLVIAPLSSLDNWKNEVLKFTPDLAVQIYHGQERFYQDLKPGITLTSYGTARNDIASLAKTNWTALVLDEAQAIKNPASQLSKKLRKIPSSFKLCLTGTPIENTTMELWALFEFLIPGYLGNRKWFLRTFLKPIERNRANLTSQVLRSVVQPFLLRRKKEEVEKDLPPKTESIIKLKMQPDQAMAYKKTNEYFKERLKKQIQDTGIENAGMYVLEGILRMRQLCLDPESANPEFSGYSSSKFDYLKETLPQLAAENHKVLVFSQFRSCLLRLADILKELNYSYSYLDGQVSRKKRSIEIDEFQNQPERHFFLISLKAGGVALNLTAADYVILLDPWWNPAVENQAVDRAHRIGQSKHVMVYRLVMENTVEEKVMELASRKREIFEEIIEGSRSGSSLEVKELMNLLDPDYESEGLSSSG